MNASGTRTGGFFSKCKTGVVDTSEISDIVKSITSSTISPKVEARTRERTGWPDRCTICHAGCINVICNSCKPLFQRGLRVKDPFVMDPLSMEGFRHKIEQYRVKNRCMPELIIIHPRAYQVYMHDCIKNGITLKTYEMEGIKVKLDINLLESEFRFV